MKNRIFATLLIAALATPTNAAAQSLYAAAERKGAEFAAQSTAARANPYKVPAIALMAGGAGLLVIGLMQERGVKTEGDIFDDDFAIKETGGSKTALVSLGVLAAVGGAGLYFWGENKKNSPSIGFGPNQVRLKVRF